MVHVRLTWVSVASAWAAALEEDWVRRSAAVSTVLACGESCALQPGAWVWILVFTVRCYVSLQVSYAVERCLQMVLSEAVNCGWVSRSKMFRTAFVLWKYSERLPLSPWKSEVPILGRPWRNILVLLKVFHVGDDLFILCNSIFRTLMQQTDLLALSPYFPQPSQCFIYRCEPRPAEAFNKQCILCH